MPVPKLNLAEKEQLRLAVKEGKVLEKKIKAEIAAFETRHACEIFFESAAVPERRNWKLRVGKEFAPANRYK